MLEQTQQNPQSFLHIDTSTGGIRWDTTAGRNYQLIHGSSVSHFESPSNKWFCPGTTATTYQVDHPIESTNSFYTIKIKPPQFTGGTVKNTNSPLDAPQPVMVRNEWTDSFFRRADFPNIAQRPKS